MENKLFETYILGKWVEPIKVGDEVLVTRGRDKGFIVKVESMDIENGMVYSIRYRSPIDGRIIGRSPKFFEKER